VWVENTGSGKAMKEGDSGYLLSLQTGNTTWTQLGEIQGLEEQKLTDYAQFIEICRRKDASCTFHHFDHRTASLR
jgi:hypothetical protein